MYTSLTLSGPLSANILCLRQCSKQLGLEGYRAIMVFNPKFGLEKCHGLVRKKRLRVRSAMDASMGGQMGHHPIFPRVNVWDPYKRLGIARDASEDEVLEARNFLLDQYAGDERSVESIEAAFENIIMKSYRERKKSKINLKSRLKKKVEESPPWVQRIIDVVEIPDSVIIQRRAALFFFIGVWSIMNCADGGPAFQVAVALAACIYFLNVKIKSIARSSIFGFVALAVGWFSASLLVPGIPSFLIPRTLPLELVSALITYFFLFLATTFLK